MCIAGRATRKRPRRHYQRDTGSKCRSLYPKPFSGRPIKVTQDSLKHGSALKAVIVNSAIANACTGEQGLKDAYAMRESLASQLGIEPELVAVSSTGVIGEHLDMEKIQAGIESLTQTPAGSGDFEEAILTTDTVIKQTCYELTIGGETVTIGGAAKGSGMIHPNMATMLGFVTTDAAIEEKASQRRFAKSLTFHLTKSQLTVKHPRTTWSWSWQTVAREMSA